MTRSSYLFTSESVAEGHPDKLCDQISDAILDLYLAHDLHARVAVEVLATTNRVVLAGEVRCAHPITGDQLIETTRQVIRDIGYQQAGFHWRDVAIESYIHDQSSDIAGGVDASATKDEGAGDQGLMFGFACQETSTLMPAPIHYAHAVLLALAQGRRRGELPLLGPDAKSQITVRYEQGQPVGVEAVVLSCQHDESIGQAEVRDLVYPYIVAALPEGWMCQDDRLYVNPTGRFVIGGPDSDTGLTGRKIIVDTYGGAAPHGGGAFSGKDPTKVDRSGAYMARYLAKNIVVAGLAQKCLIQLSYAIGVSQPVSLYVDAEGLVVSQESLLGAISELVDLSPRGIRERLDLNRPIYRPSASYGHFGRTPTDQGCFSWERTDLAAELNRVCT